MRKQPFVTLLILWLCLHTLFFTASAEKENYRSVKQIQSGDWTYVVCDDGTAKVIEYHGYRASVTVPDSIDGLAVSAIGSGTFYNKDTTNINHFLKHVTISEGITTICDGAFYACYKLEDVTIPSSVTHIGEYCINFSPTLMLLSPRNSAYASIDDVIFEKEHKRLVYYPSRKEDKTYTIPDGIQEIGAYAFSSADFTSISIPDSVTKIGEYAFEFSDLNSITIPESVMEIGQSAFSHCKLQTVILPSHLSTIEEGTFRSCDRLRSIIIPGNVVSIGKNSFNECKSLAEVSLSDGVAIIGDYAFADCKKLEEVHLPESVQHIGNVAFSNCTELRNICIPNSVASIGINPFSGSPTTISVSSEQSAFEVLNGVLFEKESKCLISYPFASQSESYEIPEGTLSIRSHAFYGNKSLQKLIIPDTVISIDAGAFSGCKRITAEVVQGSYADDFCSENGWDYTFSNSLDWLNS